MSLNCLCVIFTNQKLYPQFLISLAVTRKKSQQQQMYDEYQKYIHGILLSTVYIQTTMECCQQGAPRDVSRDISVKVLGFQRQGVSTLNCSKNADAVVSNFKRPVTEKGTRYANSPYYVDFN